MSNISGFKNILYILLKLLQQIPCSRWSIWSPKTSEASMAGDGLLTGGLGVHSMDDEVWPGLQGWRL